METGKRHFAEPWTEEERDRLRALIAAGLSTREAAAAMNRSPGSAQSMSNKLGLRTWDSVVLRTREAIREHAAMGWKSSRIAKRFGVPVAAVDAWTGRASS